MGRKVGRKVESNRGINSPISSNGECWFRTTWKSKLNETLSSKKYGEYPGNLPKEFVDRCNGDDKSINFELSVYFGYKDAESHVNQNFSLERVGHPIVDADTKRDRIYAKHFLMAQTEKFGVEIEKNWDGSIIRNESFLKRQKYRDDFFESLDKDRKKANKFIHASENHESLLPLLPETRWNGEKRWEEE